MMNMVDDRLEGTKAVGGILDEAVRRILKVVKPRRIILFGSAARGTMGPDSDLDLLIVMPDGAHRRKASVEIYKALRGIGVPKDVIVVTEQDVTAYRYNPSLVLKPALDEGKELYASA
jgi:predicted nucleotidyltransferase